MRPRYGLALLALLAPALARAAAPADAVAPEQALPAGTQVYLRWDGLAAHKAAYSKTALGKTMAGDAGTFVNSVFRQLQDGVGTLLTAEKLLGGVDVAKLRQIQTDASEATFLPPVLVQNGFVLGAEVRNLEPPQGQVTLIVPNAGAKPGSLFASMRLLALFNELEVQTKKVEGRSVSFVVAGPVNLAWWVEGKHALVQLSTDKVEAMVKAVAAKDGRLASNPLYKRVSTFKEFPAASRAFVDVAALVKLGGKRGKVVQKMLSDLGLDGLKSVVLYSGFDAGGDRGLVEIDMPGPRKGLLGLVKGKPFTLADVPPLPPDVANWSMTNLDLGALYDVGLKSAQTVLAVVNPDALDDLKNFPKQVDEALGVDLRKELLGALGERFVSYTSPSDGIFSLGQTFMFQVKDADKLEAALDKAIKNLARKAGTEVTIKKSLYRGVAVRQVLVKERGFPFRPTFAVHKGWLAVAFFPQPVQGFIARSKGDLTSWKPSLKVQESLKALPKEFVSISYTDPRPGLKQLLSIAPLIAGAIAGNVPDLDFDVATLPGAQAMTEHLFPNVGVTTDDGKKLRLESRSSLALPFELAGIDSYGLGLLLFAFRF